MVSNKQNNKSSNNCTWAVFSMVYFIFSVIIAVIIYEKGGKDWITWAFYSLIIYISGLLSAVYKIKLFGSEQYNKIYRGICIILQIIFISFPYAFKYNMAIDEWNYRKIFKKVLNASWIDVLKMTEEKGYLLIQKLLSYVVKEEYYIQMFFILFTVTVMVIALKKINNIVNVGYFIIFFFLNIYFKLMSAGLNRMFIAIAFVLLAIIYLRDNDVKKYILYVICASLFHLSALFMLVFIVPYVFKKLRYKKYFTVIFCAVLFVSIIIMNYMINFASRFMGYRYERYMNVGISISISYSTFIKIMVFVILTYFYKVIKDEKDFYLALIPIMWSGLLIDIFLSQSSIGRLVYYTDLATCLCILLVIEHRKKAYIMSVFWLSYYCSIFYMTIIRIPSLYVHLFPYSSKYFTIK